MIRRPLSRWSCRGFSGELTELEAKQVKIGSRRYIVCRNLAEARRDAEQRSAILDGLRAKLAQGDKALVGNSGFRRYLKIVSAEHFVVDETRPCCTDQLGWGLGPGGVEDVLL